MRGFLILCGIISAVSGQTATVTPTVTPTETETVTPTETATVTPTVLEVTTTTTTNEPTTEPSTTPSFPVCGSLAYPPLVNNNVVQKSHGILQNAEMMWHYNCSSSFGLNPTAQFIVHCDANKQQWSLLYSFNGWPANTATTSVSAVENVCKGYTAPSPSRKKRKTYSKQARTVIGVLAAVAAGLLVYVLFIHFYNKSPRSTAASMKPLI